MLVFFSKPSLLLICDKNTNDRKRSCLRVRARVERVVYVDPVRRVPASDNVPFANPSSKLLVSDALTRIGKQIYTSKDEGYGL